MTPRYLMSGRGGGGGVWFSPASLDTLPTRWSTAEQRARRSSLLNQFDPLILPETETASPEFERMPLQNYETVQLHGPIKSENIKEEVSW